MEILQFFRCECGAITLVLEGDRYYSCEEYLLPALLPDVDLTNVEELSRTVNCDHCVNHYGMDLCACGSGEKFWECKNGFDCCGKPMQEFGGYKKVIANDVLARRISAGQTNVLRLQSPGKIQQSFWQQAIEMEKKTEDARKALVQAIGDSIRNRPLDGVRVISDSPRCFIINSASLIRTNLSPEFYSADSQAELVTRYLGAATSTATMLERIRTMVEKKFVKISDTTYGLNPNTVQCLEEALVSV